MAPADLVLVRWLALGAVAAAFPAGTAAVFAFGLGRGAVADAVAWTYSTLLFAAFSSSFWPLPGLRQWSAAQRVQSAVLLFLPVSYGTHLTWELGWLILHRQIAAGRDAAWAYPWWAYIDGGDRRYATAPADLLAMEVLSVANGVVGSAALYSWHRAPRASAASRRAVLAVMATAVVHLYSTALYYLSEVVAGCPNVDTASFTGLWIKFVLANLPWLTMPWLVLRWGHAQLFPDADKSL
jgi:hypothetical protein